MNSSSINTFQSLNTARLHLRRLSENDSREIFELRTDSSVNQFLDRAKPESLQEALEFIRLINRGIDEGKSLYWVVCLKDNPRLLGTTGLWNFSADRKQAEIGFELSPAYQGMGLMQEAVASIIRYVFDTISLRQIDACVHKDNIKSIRLLEKCNFLLQVNRSDENDPSIRIYSLKAS